MWAEEIKRAKPRPKIVRLLALLPVGTVVTRPRCPRLGSLAVRTFRLVTLATVAIAVAACAIQPTDLSPVEVGATRATVEGVLGKPVKSMQTDTGRIDTYKYNMGYTPTGGSGGSGGSGDGCAPFITVCIGVLAIVAVVAPIAHGIRYERQRGDIEVTYGPQDTVVRVETTWVRQGREEAEKWKVEDAQYLLAYSYLQQGRIAEALKGMCLAANEGHANAQDRLGDAYRGDPLLSRNRPQDPVKAYLWYSLAIVNGSPFSEKSREDLAKEMTPAQIAEAERLAKEWKPDPSACDTGAATSSPMN